MTTLVYTSREHYFPPMPLTDWEPTKDTLHLFLQIVGKIRMALHPKLNHWWHVTLYPTSRGLTTGRIPYKGKDFEIEFDFIEHVLKAWTSSGEFRQFPLPLLTVAEFYHKTMETLAQLGIHVDIVAKPYMNKSTIPFAEDSEHHTYDRDAVHRYWMIQNQIANIFEEFRGQFCGKSTPVQLYWHSMDLVVTRFSGKKAPPRTTGTRVDKEAYSHEVISFGFWPGDANFREPAFYSYTYPEPAGLTSQPLSAAAKWTDMHGSNYAILTYENMRTQPDPRAALRDFLDSAYQAGAKAAGWPIEDFKTPGV